VPTRLVCLCEGRSNDQREHLLQCPGQFTEIRRRFQIHRGIPVVAPVKRRQQYLAYRGPSRLARRDRCGLETGPTPAHPIFHTALHEEPQYERPCGRSAIKCLDRRPDGRCRRLEIVSRPICRPDAHPQNPAPSHPPKQDWMRRGTWFPMYRPVVRIPGPGLKGRTKITRSANASMLEAKRDHASLQAHTKAESQQFRASIRAKKFSCLLTSLLCYSQ